MAVAARILFQIVLMVLLSGIVVFQRANLHKELLTAAPLDLSNALHRLLRLVVGVVNAGLVLASDVIALPVLYCRVDDIEVSQQQGIQAHLLRVVLHPHSLSEAGVPLTDRPVVGICLAGAIGVAALSIQDAWNGLHQLFYAPKAAACQIDDVFRVIHMHTFLTGQIGGLSSQFRSLGFPFWGHLFLLGGAAAQQQRRSKQKGQYAPTHGVVLLSEEADPFVSPDRRQEPGRCAFAAFPPASFP